jgi:hypothetical protein
MDDIVDEDVAFGTEGVSALGASVPTDWTDTFGNVEGCGDCREWFCAALAY